MNLLCRLRHKWELRLRDVETLSYVCLRCGLVRNHCRTCRYKWEGVK